MTKKEIAKMIAEETGLTQEQTREVVQRVFDGITETLLSKGRIELRNFGVFEVKKRKPRTDHRLADPEPLAAMLKRTTSFSPGQ